MNAGALPLAKIFWGIFAVEAMVAAYMLAKVLNSIGDYKGENSGLVGAWLVLIPIVVLVLVAALFLMVKAPWIRIACILVLLLPVLAPLVGAPVQLVTKSVGSRLRDVAAERGRRGEHLFPEAGQRKLAAAIAEHDVAAIKAALPGAGDVNRQFPTHLPYYVPLGGNETFLTFALEHADDSDGFAEVVRVLLAAGANPNVPRGLPLAKAMVRSTRVMELLLNAGADPNADNGAGGLVWWNVLEIGERGNPDVTRLQILLDHGADTKHRGASGEGPVERAVEGARWNAVALLAQRIPGAKNIVIGRNVNIDRDGETVYAVLTREVRVFKASGQPIPDDMRAALAQFDGSAK
jgi:hypothetical protein